MDERKINSSILISLDCLSGEIKNIFLSGAKLKYYFSKLDYDTLSKFEEAYVGYLELLSALIDYICEFRDILNDAI